MRKTSTPTFAFAACLTTVLLLTACGGGGGGGSSTPPPANTPPVANAGANQTVDAGVVVTLDGSGSADADGTISGYTWTQTGGSPAVTLSSRTVARPTFDAPAVTATTTLTFSLVVRDNRNANSNTATVGVTINPPVAGTVTRILVEEGTTVPVGTVVMEVDDGTGAPSVAATFTSRFGLRKIVSITFFVVPTMKQAAQKTIVTTTHTIGFFQSTPAALDTQ